MMSCKGAWLYPESEGEPQKDLKQGNDKHKFEPESSF